MPSAHAYNVGARKGGLVDKRDPRHGANGYFYWGCRCDTCRSEASAYQREYRKRRAENLGAEQHGTNAAYTIAGCRCTPCRQAATQHRATYGNRPQKGTTVEVSLKDLA